MVQYKIEDVEEGMIIGQSMFDENGKLLVTADFCLETKHIDLLKKKGYASVFINVEGTEDVEAKSIISQHVKQEFTATLSKSSQGIEHILEKSRQNKKNIADIILNDKKQLNDIISKSGALQVINKVVDDILAEPWAVVNLEMMQKTDNTLYTHVINVTIVSLCIGYKFRFSQQELKQLGLGVINYDIGMLAIPKNILTKETELTKRERELFMKHTVYGHMMLTDIPSIPPTSSIVALSHHEHQNGTGHPQGLKGENQPPIKNIKKGKLIHRFAEIVAVADRYEMFTYGRKHFSEKMSPEQVIIKLIDLKKTELNFEILKTLLTIIPVYPVGMRIRVTDSPIPELLGSYGVVAKINPERLFEPTILLIESRHKKRLPKPVMLDFSKHRGFAVELVG